MQDLIDCFRDLGIVFGTGLPMSVFVSDPPWMTAHDLNDGAG
ncbi:MAG: hypothetical protein ACE5F5_08930 [Acidimicrobiia bacterium]